MLELIVLMWFFSLFGSQFYIFSSGTPQPAHMVMVALFLVYLSKKDFLTVLVSSATLLAPLAFFVFYVVLLNISWALIIQDLAFILSTLFWVFSFLIVVVVVYALNNPAVRGALKWAAFAGVFFLSLIWVLNLGRYNYGSRFNGYFNDPNQMAFWVLCATAIFLNLSFKVNRLVVATLGVVALMAVFSTASRSALLGIGFILFGIFLKFLGYDGSTKTAKNIIYLSLGLILFPVLVYFTLSTELASGVVERFVETDFSEQADLRGYGRLANYPEYLMLGAGQGLDSRFGSVHEIHSSWVAVLFYYGIIGFSVFSYFTIQIFNKLDLSAKFMFLAPVLYGLSTYGLRSPVFWIFIASAIYSVNKKGLSLER